MCSTGDCFVVLPPHCVANTVVFGRNSEDSSAVSEAQEVHYYDVETAVAGQSDGGAEPNIADKQRFRMILQKPRVGGVWGGDYGANEKNVCCGISWTAENGVENGSHLCATDIARYALATSDSAVNAVDCIGALAEAHGAEDAKLNFIICDPTEVWTISCCGKLWAAQRFTEGFKRFPSNGLAVTVTIDKSSDQLADAVKTLGLWNGEGELNFAACFDSTSPDAEIAWSGTEPSGDGTYALTNMFDTVRSAARTDSSRSASVSVLTNEGISCHWFTATPNASESVFKPFVFAPNPKISPLIKVPAAGEDNGNITLLHKLHAQRKPIAIDDLKALEAACVVEVNNYLAEHPIADEELDELMKDCVEAEVKFYR